MALRQTGYVIASAAALALGLNACAPQQAAAPAAPAAAPVSFDGTYVGTIAVSGTGAGIPRGGCDTTPNIVLKVSGNSFTYRQDHPAAKTNSPTFGTVTYTARIAQDGRISGTSDYSGSIRGQVANGQMSGIMDGAVCVYTFSAQKQ
ncbi:MAG: hypothetical protein JSR21_20700 [Proteobacteria bacterium]|nr:hypothetical protein [Pseudomonadota bacterium]